MKSGIGPEHQQEVLMRFKLLAAAGAFAAAAALVSSATAAEASPRQHGSHLASVHRGYTQVVVAPAVYALIQRAQIAPAPLGSAKAGPYKGTVAADFPIVGYRLANLRIKHAGGLSLSTPQRAIELRNFSIDLGRAKVSARVSGSIGDVGRVDLFTIRPSDHYSLGLVRLTLTQTAAGALNQTFGVIAFSSGETFGYATPRPFAQF
ncbi:hypothetical protein [Microlunatus elymi]|uniref:hypothetical protein n=1 Tax=Microlunatus elymi TaxID=2596828 RepID=UPI001AEFB26C|nr:hypothetical protein [Microlunatus elymi]